MKNAFELKTKNGVIIGNKCDGYNAFLGIEYAKAGRFEEPIQCGAWNGKLDATNPGPCVMQYWGLYGHPETKVNEFYVRQYKRDGVVRRFSEEGSLMLNIFTPENADKCPVFFFIHGGGYTSGSANDNLTTTSFAKEGIVSVFINYRLGFLSSPMGDGYTGNLGFKDQLCAFDWVKKNIADFGGDPDNICICGESAGAYSVQNFLNTPKLSENAFKSAIMMSGAGDTHPLDLLIDTKTAEDIWIDLKSKMGVKSIDDFKDIDLTPVWKQWVFTGMDHTTFYASPVIDGEYLPESTGDAIRNGHLKNVPLMLGMLSEDMWPTCLYRGIMGICEARKAEGSAPVYNYFIDYQCDEKFGAFHAADISFAFKRTSALVRSITEADKLCEKKLFGAFVNFIKTGDPNRAGENSWQSAQESWNKFYEVDGKSFGMITPDINALKTQTEKNIPFPFAD